MACPVCGDESDRHSSLTACVNSLVRRLDDERAFSNEMHESERRIFEQSAAQLSLATAEIAALKAVVEAAVEMRDVGVRYPPDVEYYDPLTSEAVAFDAAMAKLKETEKT